MVLSYEAVDQVLDVLIPYNKHDVAETKRFVLFNVKHIKFRIELIETGMIKGRTLTSFPSLQTDLKNAGAHWVDQEVVVDNGLITSRKPADLDAFNAKAIEAFAEEVHNQA